MGRTSDARERLVDEASQLFHARSYESVGVQELCEPPRSTGQLLPLLCLEEDLAAAASRPVADHPDEVLDPPCGRHPAARPARAPVRAADQGTARAARESGHPAARSPTCRARSAATSPSCAASWCACTTPCTSASRSAARRREGRRAAARDPRGGQGGGAARHGRRPCSSRHPRRPATAGRLAKLALALARASD